MRKARSIFGPPYRERKSNLLTTVGKDGAGKSRRHYSKLIGNRVSCNAVRCTTVLPQGHKYTGVYSHHSVRLNRSFLFTFAWRLTRLTRPSPILHLGGPPCRPGRQLRAFCARRFYASRLAATFSAAPSLEIRWH